MWADHSFALRMFASVICDPLNSIPIPGRSLHKTVPPVSRCEGGGNQGRDEGQGQGDNQAGGEKGTTSISS